MAMGISKFLRLGAASVCAVLLGGTALASASSGVLVVTSNTTLSEDHQGQIVIAADGVTLDCARHVVSGPGPFGILLSGRSGVTVKNCDVTGFGHGIGVLSSNGNTFTNNVSHDNSLTGFAFDQGGSANRLAGNTARGNGGNGFQIVGQSNMTLENNTAVANGDTAGIALGFSNNNVLRQNRSSQNANHGVHLFSSSGNQIV